MSDSTEMTQTYSHGIQLHINTLDNGINIDNSDNILSPIKLENHTFFNTFIHYLTLFYNFMYAYAEYCVDNHMV